MGSFEKEHYGTMPDGSSIHQFTLTNSNGMELKVIEYGGIITHLTAPDKDGVFEDIVLGHDALEEYLESSYYLGALIGRYGNRIANAKFSLDGVEYALEVNDNPNSLHGGDSGYHARIWKGEELKDDNGTALKLTYQSKDGEEGFPGNLDIEVMYTLTDENALEIHYKATTDKKTIVNLTQHSYFNLSSMKEDILSHELELHADRYVHIREGAIPTGKLEPVAGTPFDFTSQKVIGKDIDADHPQLQITGGFDVTWVLNETRNELKKAGSLTHPESGRIMEIWTTEPGIQFYSGNALKNTPSGKKGSANNRRMGLCLETQHFPDSPNQPEFPSVVLDVGETYRSTTVYRFSVK
ncbi:MAG: aldose epimerase family protein [Balneolaceae bacterium]